MVDGTVRPSRAPRLVTLLALVAGLLVLGVVPAAAYWAVSADGSGRRTLTATATGGGLVAVASVKGHDALAPGGSVPLEVEVTNRGRTPAEVAGVRVRKVRVTPSAGRTCPAGVFGFSIGAGPGTVRPGRSVVLDGELRLAGDAPPGCQGAVVDLDLTVSSSGGAQ